MKAIHELFESVSLLEKELNSKDNQGSGRKP